MGLSTFHISPQSEIIKQRGLSAAEYFALHRTNVAPSERKYLRPEHFESGSGEKYITRYADPVATVTLAVGGSLAKVSSGMKGDFVGGVRGSITGFSSGSRRRLMRLIASLDRKARPVFVTLTYPDSIPSVKKAKRDIDVFRKRMAREFKGGSFLWRVEEKTRKTGQNAGRVAPHFHLLVYGVSFRALLDYVRGSWFALVGSDDERHLSSGTSVERIRSFGGIMRYVGKYMAKVEDGNTEWVGRVWGIAGRKNLPFVVELVLNLSPGELVKLVRLGRKMIRARGRSFVYGLTWIVNAERVLDYMESDCFT